MSFFKKLFGKKENETPPDVVKREGEPDVYYVAGEEERMNFAMEKARLTISYFKESLTRPKATQQSFSLKARIEDGEMTEHIWLSDVSYDEDKNFYGTVNNEPVDVTNVTFGQQIGIATEHVSDWMIIEDGRLIGGYTIRAVRDGMQGKQREEFDKSIGIPIDEGVDYFEHDFSTPEGAILCLEDAYDAKDIEKAIACKDFETEARLMLEKMGKEGGFADHPAIREQAAKALKLSFIKLLQEEGFPDFKGVLRAFPHREKISDDHYIITEVCRYPNRSKSSQRLHVWRKNGEWKVLNPVD